MAGIFKTYDIRGLTSQITDEIAYKVGHAFALLRKQEKKSEHLTFCVGRDMRSTSERYQQAIIDGITDAGCNVLDIGLVSTPMFYFACQQDDVQGGIMVTASHNAATYNGFKICRDNAEAMTYDDGISAIEAYCAQNKIVEPQKELGSSAPKEIKAEYIQHISQFCQLKRPLKVVVDAGNGMGALDAELLAQNFVHLEVVPLYFTLDGSFPNHEANPTVPENLVDLQKAVVEHQADFGVAFDGDADRIMFVDETGDIVSASQALALFATDRLGNQTGSVVGDLLLSKSVEQAVENAHGKFIQTRVGHSFVHRTMQKEDALVGGEFSGHMYFREFKGADCALLAFANMLTIVSKSSQLMSELVDEYDNFYAAPQQNFTVKDQEKSLKNIREKFDKDFTSDLDGYSFSQDAVWFNVRKSNTEPLLRVTLEGQTKKDVEEMLTQLKALME